MDNNLIRPVGSSNMSSDINAVPLGGHQLHKSEDPIRSVPASSDLNAPLGGHVIHRAEDPIRPVGFSGVSEMPYSGTASDMPSGFSTAPAASTINPPIAYTIPADELQTSSHLPSSYSSNVPSQGIVSRGDNIIRTTDNIHDDVRQAGLSAVEPAVRDTQDAAQNLKWELERERQRQFQLDEIERQNRLRQMPTDQAIKRTEAVIAQTDELKKEAKQEGFTDINPAIKDTRDAAKNLKKELESERKNLEPHKEGFLDRAKGWLGRDKESDYERPREEKEGFMDRAKGWLGRDKESSEDLSEYERERRLHSKDELKHHDAVIKDINKRDKVGEEKEGFMDRAKGWLGRDKDQDSKAVVAEYEEARMQHPDLVVKYHDDVVDDINKRDRVGEEGLIRKVKNLFKGSSEPSADNDNSKPHVYAPTHPVHDFQENPTTQGILPSATSTRFPQNTQTVLLPEQRSSLPTAAMADNAASSDFNSTSSQLGSTQSFPTSFPSSSMAPSSTYTGENISSNPFTPSDSSFSQGSSNLGSSNLGNNWQQQQQQQQQPLLQQQQPSTFGGSNLQSSSSSYMPPASSASYNPEFAGGSQFNPSTSSLANEGSTIGPFPTDPMSTRIDSSLEGSHAQLYRPSGARQADV